MLVVISTKIVSCNQIRLSRKIAVVSCFAPRLLIVGVAVTRLVWLYPLATQHGHQHRVWEPMIASQIQICVSIITASIPFVMPYCRDLYGRLHASTLKASRRFQDEENTYSRSSLWFRRHHKSRDINPQNSSTEGAPGYELLPKSSPYISSARPTSPRSTTGLQLSPEEKANVRGLNIYIPHRSPKKQSNELVSPRSQSSGIWSPWTTSPQALLLHSFVPSRKAPIPPPRKPCFSPPSPSSCYSSRSATPTLSTPHTQFSFLSPLEQSIVGTPQPERKTSILLGKRSSKVLRPTKEHSIPHFSAKLSPRIPPPSGAFSHKPSQNVQMPRSRINSHIKTAPSSILTKGKSRPGSIQDLTSPMGAAIHSWFDSPNTQRLPQFSPLSPSSARDSFDQHMVSPTEPIGMPTYPLFTHTRSPARSTMFINEPSLSHSLYYLSRAPEMNATPLVRDVRNNPCVVVHKML